MPATAIIAAALSGAASCVGPCAAPRYAVLASLLGKAYRTNNFVSAALFIVGLVAGSMLIVLSSAVASSVMKLSGYLYAALAVVLGASGCYALLDPPEKSCGAREVHNGSSGIAAFVGALCSLIVSPCCTPTLVALGAVASSSPSPWLAVSIAAAFACGHIGTLAAIALLGTRVSGLSAGTRALRAANTVSAGLLIAIAGYYAVLA